MNFSKAAICVVYYASQAAAAWKKLNCWPRADGHGPNYFLRAGRRNIAYSQETSLVVTHVWQHGNMISIISRNWHD